MTEWVSIAIQAGGAVGVCGMFLWHLNKKEVRFFAAMDKQTAYLQARDAQSKEIALSGHSALGEVAKEVGKLRESLVRRNGSGLGSVEA